MRANDNQQAVIDGAAGLAWDEMDENERFGVSVGLFPLHIMEKHDPKFADVDSQSFAVALMDVVIAKHARQMGCAAEMYEALKWITDGYLKGEDIRNKLVAQQKRMIKTKKVAYEQEEARKLISKSVKKEIRRTDAKKKQKGAK